MTLSKNSWIYKLNVWFCEYPPIGIIELFFTTVIGGFAFIALLPVYKIKWDVSIKVISGLVSFGWLVLVPILTLLSNEPMLKDPFWYSLFLGCGIIILFLWGVIVLGFVITVLVYLLQSVYDTLSQKVHIKLNIKWPTITWKE